VFDDRSTVHASVEGWLHRSTAETLLNRTGRSYAEVAREAAQRTFAPFALDQNASIVLRNRAYRASSRNVIARLPGRDRPDEHVVFTAHWDHLGQDPARAGDTVFNGAVDNATGVAGLIEIAAAFARMKQRPRRSILFLAPGAEEHGLLGSRYYTQHPTVPLNRTAAVFNLDGMNVWGPTRDVTVVGAGQSDLETVLAQAAMQQDRTLRPDPAPEKGHYFRSDHFSFARKGVPSVYVAPGVDAPGHGPTWVQERHQTYLREHYHQPSDEYDPDWDLRGMADDLRLLVRAGHRVATMHDFPRWKDGSAFKPRRSLPAGSP
jgi:Zn-dependent M28 family amino/carboxypeptidase